MNDSPDKPGIFNPWNTGVVYDVQLVTDASLHIFRCCSFLIIMGLLTEFHDICTRPWAFSDDEDLFAFFYMIDCWTGMIDHKWLSIDKAITVILNRINCLIT